MRNPAWLLLLLAPVVLFAGEMVRAMPSAELVKMLLDSNQRDAAYFELARRADSQTTADFAEFRDHHRNPEVIVCPQPNEPPLYVVLSDFLGAIKDPSGKRQPAALNNTDRRKDLLIDVFDARGNQINTPSGNNVLDGMIADINGDGSVERADQTRFGLQDNWNAQVFTIERIGRQSEPLLAVLYNWGEDDDWDFQFSDHDGDGRIEIELGPYTENGIVARVVFFWNPLTHSYESSSGPSGPHWKVLTTENVWSQMKGLMGTLASFEKDRESLSKWDRIAVQKGQLPESKIHTVKAASNPYQYKSLRSLSNQEIYDYMGMGKETWDLEREDFPETTVPDSFWSAPLQDAVLQLAEVNRSREHRILYKLQMKSDADPPPDDLSVSYSISAAHSNLDPNFYLHASTGNSYFAYAAWSCPDYLDRIGSRFDDTNYWFGFCEMKNEDAKRIAQGLWLIRQIETVPEPDDSQDFYFNTAGGPATVRFIPLDGKTPISITGNVEGWVSDEWKGAFREDELAAMTHHVMTDAAPSRLEVCRQSMQIYNAAPQTVADIHRLAAQFLGWFSPDESRISFRIVQAAIDAAGDLALKDLVPQLRKLEAQLPPAAKTIDCEDELWKQADEIDQENRASIRSGNLTDIQSSMDRVQQRRNDAIGARHGAIPSCAIESIRSAIHRSLAQIQAANHPSQLRDWALSKKDQWQWALSLLAKSDPPAYIATLESLIQMKQDENTVYLLRLLAKADVSRAARFARTIPAEEATRVSVEAFSILAQAGIAAEVDQRLPVVIALATAPDTDFELRAEAIDALAPKNALSRIHDSRIDQAFLTVLAFQPQNSADFEGKRAAAQALSIRTGTRYFDQILAALDTSVFDQDGILKVLEEMESRLNGAQKQILQQWINHNFEETAGPLNELMFMIWSFNAGDLQRQIEQIATSGPNDVEGDQCNESSDHADKTSGRCHAARKVAALWNEEDPLTRVKLLVSLYLQNVYEFDADIFAGEVRMDRLKSQLKDSVSLIPKNQRSEILEYLNWCDSQHPFIEDETIYIPQRNQIVSFLRNLIQE